MRLFTPVRLMIVVLFVLNGCGGGGGSNTGSTDGGSGSNTGSTDGGATGTSSSVNISGVVSYDKIHPNSNYIGLDYGHITQEPARAIQIDAVGTSNQIIATGTTDNAGRYTLSVPANTQLKIRASAKMFKTGSPSWDVAVENSNNRNALYVIEGSTVSSGTVNSQRNLNAPSGWGGSRYTRTRAAGPFAMLDSIYTSMQKVLEADKTVIFPPLVVNWYAGNVNGTYYTDGNLFIFGDEDLDTDEYDDHVISHEWGHYYEDKLSRSDSIGGSHGGDDTLDIRVAFSEGWGNAFSAIALANPVYFDTSGDTQANGFNFDVESEVSTVKGWYNESSIQRILYDVYDDAEDGADIVSFGFAPIHRVFTGIYKATPAFTSLFTFITALKNENAGQTEEIDALTGAEDIATITDIYGTGRTNKAANYPYSTLTLGETLQIQTNTTFGGSNKLGNRKYVRFTVSTAKTYTISITQTNGSSADPDFDIYDTAPFGKIESSQSEIAGREQMSVSLSAGEYLLDVSDFNDRTL